MCMEGRKCVDGQVMLWSRMIIGRKESLGKARVCV